MRRVVALRMWTLAGLVASCGPHGPGPSPALERQPSSAWTAVSQRPSPLLTTVRTRPELVDLVLYLEAREAARRGDDTMAIARVAALEQRVPDSIWLPSARLLAGQLARKSGDDDAARAWLVAARDTL